MKTYRYYKVGLFIGLLALLTFNALSSCVNTRQKPAWWPDFCFARQQLGFTYGSWHRWWNSHPGIDVCCTSVTKVLYCTSSIPALVWITTRYYKTQSNQVEIFPGWHMNNPMNCFNEHTRDIIYNMTPELEASITKVIKDHERKLGIGSTIQSGSNDPMILDEQVKKKIISSGWSQKKLQYFLDQDLNIEAKDERGMMKWLNF